MVRFGERLEQLKQAGWEHAYIDYARLKVLIDQIDSSASAAAPLLASDVSVRRHARSRAASLKAPAATRAVARSTISRARV